MTLIIEQVQTEFFNRSQSWIHESLWRVPWTDNHQQVWLPKQIRVEIIANAYRNQSHARISEWSTTDSGWQFFTSIPTHKWYGDAPSYVTRRENILQAHFTLFRLLEAELIETWVNAIYRPGRLYELKLFSDA